MENCTTTIDSASNHGPTVAEARALVAAGIRLMMRGFGVWIVVVSDGILDRLDRARERRVLRTFDDRALSDIGLSRSDLDRYT